jgi:hypothetical protein
MTLPRFFLCDLLKDRVFKNKLRTGALKGSFSKGITPISPATLAATFTNTVRRVGLCFQTEGN